MNEATRQNIPKSLSWIKNLKISLIAVISLLTSAGCTTYLGYDAVKYQEDIPGTKKDLKETALDYRVDIMVFQPDKKVPEKGKSQGAAGDGGASRRL